VHDLRELLDSRVDNGNGIGKGVHARRAFGTRGLDFVSTIPELLRRAGVATDALACSILRFATPSLKGTEARAFVLLDALRTGKRTRTHSVVRDHILWPLSLQ